MFKRFVQNNIVLVSLLGGSLLLGFFLSLLAVAKHVEMQNLQREMEELRDKIGNLHRGPVHSVSQNLTRLTLDAAFYDECFRKAERIYGCPLQKALDKMAAAVALTDPDTGKKDFTDGDSMRECFMAFYNREKGNNTRGQIYDMFRRAHGQNWNAAMKEFVLEIDPLTQEPINSTNKDEVLVSLLGLPRDCESNAAVANAVINTVHRRLDEAFAKNKAEVGKNASDYGVPLLAPSADRGKIIRSLKVLEFSSDMAARIAKSGITSLDLVRLATDNPKPVDGLLYYDFSIRVTGSLASIRELVNQLNAAFLEQRVYVVQSLELSRASLEAARVLNRRFGQVNNDQEKKKSGSSMQGSFSAEEEKKEEPQDESLLPYEERKDYANPVLGQDNLCCADLNVIYVVLVQKELE